MKGMDSHRWQMAAGVLLAAVGAIMAVAGGLAAVAVGVATTLAKN